MFITDGQNNMIRTLNATFPYTVSWYLGVYSNLNPCVFANGHPGKASFCVIGGITGDNLGNLYLTDQWHNTVRKADAKSRYVTTYLGGFNIPFGIFLTPNYLVYICDNDGYLKLLS